MPSIHRPSTVAEEDGPAFQGLMALGASPSDSSFACSPDLLEELKKAFSGPEEYIIAAFKVVAVSMESRSTTGEALPRGHVGKDKLTYLKPTTALNLSVHKHSHDGMSEDLAIVLTMRSKSANLAQSPHLVRDARPHLDICQRSQGTWERRRSHSLAHLLMVKFPTETEPISLTLKFGVVSSADLYLQTLGLKEGLLYNVNLINPVDRMDLAAVVIHLPEVMNDPDAKSRAGGSDGLRGPEVVAKGESVAAVDVVHMWWGARNAMQLPFLTPLGEALLMPELLAAQGQGNMLAKALLSKEEEQDLTLLLDKFSLTVGNINEFKQALRSYHSALETGNVHTILESAPMLDRVGSRLNDSFEQLDHLSQNLQVFDHRLRHMRADIAAIEARNNALELQATNRGNLLKTLDALLEDLDPPKGIEPVLSQGSRAFRTKKLSEVVAAGWQLHLKIDRLDPKTTGGLPKALHKMTAVREQTQRLRRMSDEFVQTATQFLTETLLQLISQQTQRVDDGSVSMKPNRTMLHVMMLQYMPLARLVAALNRDSIKHMAKQIVQAHNLLIRSQLRVHRRHLQVAVQMDARATTAAAAEPTRMPNPTMLFGRKLTSLQDGSQSSGQSPPPPAAMDGMTVTDGVADELSMRDGPKLNLHAAWAKMMAVFVPLLSRDCQFMSSILLLEEAYANEHVVRTNHRDSVAVEADKVYAWIEDDMAEHNQIKHPEEILEAIYSKRASLSAHGQECIGLMLASTEKDFCHLVDGTARNFQHMCIPMQAITLLRVDQLTEFPAVSAVTQLLRIAADRLGANFVNYIDKHVLEIEKFKVVAANGSKSVKWTHILPYIRNLATLVHSIEELLLTADIHSPTSAEAAMPMDATSGSNVFAANGRTGGANVLLGSMNSTHFPGPLGDMEQENAGKLRIFKEVRKQLDVTYQRLIDNMMGSLDTIAATDAKHGARLLLENYQYFAESIAPLASAVPVLETSRRMAVDRSNREMKQYVVQQLEYGRLWHLIEFSEQLDTLLQEVAPEEVQFQVHADSSHSFFPQDVYNMLVVTLESVDRKLPLMHTRIQKHLARDAPSLVRKVWAHLEEVLLQRYARLEEQLALAYPNIELSPTLAQMKEYCAAVGA